MKRSREQDDEDEHAAGSSEDVVIVPVSKIMNLDTEDSEPYDANNIALQCSLPGHSRGTTFHSYAEYEKHYAQLHSNRCLECGRNFPTAHILSLHIQEHHDALTEVKREKGASTYACFVEICKDNFQSFKERQDHLVRDHTYPANYFFAVTKFGINNRRQSMLLEHRDENIGQRKESHSEGRKPKGRAANPAAECGDTIEAKDVQMIGAENTVEGQQVVAEDMPMGEAPLVVTKASADVATGGVKKPQSAVLAGKQEQQVQQVPAVVDAEMEDLAGAMSSLQFVPRAVRLGQKQKPRR